MLAARRNQALVAGQTVFAVLLVAADLATPVGWPLSAFLVIVVAAAMWLPGVRPIWVSAVVCAVITVVTWFLYDDRSGPLGLDALNRFNALVVIAVVAALCATYKRAEVRARGLAAIVESSPDAIYSRTLDGVLTSWNAGAEELLGYRASEIVGRPFDVLAAPEALADYAKVVDGIRAGRSSVTQETVLVRKDGSRVPISVSAAGVRDDHGQVAEIASIARDITERRRAEQELQAARDAAQEASRAKSDFLASMSHEIRTPMNGVLGMLDLAFETGLTPEQRHYVERAHASADHLLRIINDILDFSKIEAGHLDLAPEPFGLRESLGELLKAFGPRAHRKGLELALDVDANVPDALVADVLRLNQVLTNIVGNAVKFTDRGEVVLAVQREPASSAPDGVMLRFSLTDTGPGIPRDKQQVIFHAFTQADSSASRRFGGSGLGLTISARLVELMGGRMWLDSEPGRGSTFHFTARFELQREGPATPAREPVDVRGLPVLAADDNATNRHILGEMLASWHMKPTMAAGGREAIATLRHAAASGHPFTLVVLDAVMPEVDGFAVAEEIKRDRALADATIMMLTSADRGGELARCRQLGVAAYLRKPIKQSELLNAIVAAVGGSSRFVRAPAAAPDASKGRSRRGLRVLVAEDNEFNQELAIKLLQRWGHTGVVAADGEQAVAAWAREPFDLILMDLQMPGMDGFAVTRAIRDSEAASRGVHIPIVALTAHALKGDRERCLAAGMDGYVSKPIRSAELADAIAALLPAPDVAPAAGSATGTSSAAEFDAALALAAFDGDRGLLVEMADTFCRQCPAMLGEMRDALDRGDAEALARSVHRFTGALGTFSAQGAYEMGVEIERRASAGATDELRDLYARFAEAVQAVRQVLDLLREPPDEKITR